MASTLSFGPGALAVAFFCAVETAMASSIRCGNGRMFTIADGWHPDRRQAAREGSIPMTDDAADRRQIRELIENWALWRDGRDWARFRTLWHDDGVMNATWFQGGVDVFIKVSEEGYQRGARSLHFLGGSSIDVAGTRAIAQTKMTITSRGPVEGVVCDVVCPG